MESKEHDVGERWRQRLPMVRMWRWSGNEGRNPPVFPRDSETTGRSSSRSKKEARRVPSSPATDWEMISENIGFSGQFGMREFILSLDMFLLGCE